MRPGLVILLIVVLFLAVSRSSAEAELRAMAAVTAEVTWLRWLLVDFGVLVNGPTTLLSDSTGAISIARDPVKHELTKHIAVDASYTRLQEQSNIVSSEILSIDFNPSCSHQLAFHLDDGWSGALNVNTLSLSHLHCPPPAWLEGMAFTLHKHLRKPTWLPAYSIYAVGSSSNNGMYLLDFHPDTSSACHVDYNEEMRGSEENQPAENRFIPLSQRVLSCAAHPLSHTILAGTQFSSLLMLSQKYETIGNSK